MSSRQTAIEAAHTWAATAERHAHVFIAARAEQDTVEWAELKSAALELEEHARGMALMWAAIAQLHGVDAELAETRDQLTRVHIELDHWMKVIVPELRAERDAAVAAAKARDAIRTCDQVRVHPAHQWFLDGQQFGCIGFPEIVLCHSRYQHAEGIAACTREPHHRGGLHEGDGFSWPTSQATEETRHFRCGYCGCAANPAYCDCKHVGDAVPHQRPPSAPS